MADDLVEQLRYHSLHVMPGHPDDICSEAASEIERLRAALELACQPLTSLNWKTGKPYSYLS